MPIPKVPKPLSPAKIEALKIEREFLISLHHAGIPSPIPEFRFAKAVPLARPIPSGRPRRRRPPAAGREWKFDYAWPDIWTCLEIEGGTFDPNGGRHNSGPGFKADCLKYSVAAILGWAVIRVTHRQITEGTALMLVKAAHWGESWLVVPRPKPPTKRKEKNAIPTQ